MNQAWQHLVGSPLLGLTATVGAYVLAVRLWRRAGRHPLLTPAFTSMAVLAVLVGVLRIPFDAYWAGGQYLNFLLGPATAALAVPLHRARHQVRRLLVPVGVGVLCGAATAMVTAVACVRLLGGDVALAATVAPKSATTPISMALSAATGGNPSLTAVLTILTGVLGAMAGPALLGLARVRDPRVRGLAMGVSSHGVGTARALQDGPVTGAFAALAMALSGVVTALLMPVVMALLG